MHALLAWTEERPCRVAPALRATPALELAPLRCARGVALADPAGFRHASRRWPDSGEGTAGRPVEATRLLLAGAIAPEIPLARASGALPCARLRLAARPILPAAFVAPTPLAGMVLAGTILPGTVLAGMPLAKALFAVEFVSLAVPFPRPCGSRRQGADDKLVHRGACRSRAARRLRHRRRVQRLLLPTARTPATTATPPARAPAQSVGLARAVVHRG